MAKDPKLTAEKISKLIGGSNNVVQYTNCMTRLRLKAKDASLVNVSDIKKVENVMGVVQAGDEFQIILGPGFVKKVADEFGKITSVAFGGEVDAAVEDAKLSKLSAASSLEATAKAVKAQNKAKQTSSIQKFLAKFANIFGPLIVGYIGAGILYGIGSILESTYKVYDFNALSTSAYEAGYQVMRVAGGSSILWDGTPLVAGESLQLFLNNEVVTDGFGKAVTVGTNGWVGGYWTNATAQSWGTFFMQIFNIWKDIALIMVGWRTAKAFGGTGAYGAIGAAFFMGAGGAFGNGFASTMFLKTTASAATYEFAYNGEVYNYSVQQYNFLGISVENPYDNWLTLGFRPTTPDSKALTVMGVDYSTGAPSVIYGDGGDGTLGTFGSLQYAAGNMLGALMIGGAVVPLEKLSRKISPESIDIVLTSTLTIGATVFFNYFLILPLSGILFSWIGWLFSTLVTSAVGCALLAGIFLVSVAFGIHQGFVPVYAAVIATTGTNALFPVLAIGGAGQVGMAIAMFKRAPKDALVRKQISGAIIPGILGVGEPLIFGVSLPRVKPFITACIGAMLGGLFIGIVNAWWAPWHGDIYVGLSSQFGPSGILAIPLMTNVAGNVPGQITPVDISQVKVSGPWIGMVVYTFGLIFGYIGGFLATFWSNKDVKDLA